MGNASSAIHRENNDQSTPRALSISSIEYAPGRRRASSALEQSSTVARSYNKDISQVRTLRQIHNSLQNYKTQLRHISGDNYDDIYQTQIEQADIGILYVKEDVEIQRSMKRSLQEFCRNIRVISPRPGYNIYAELKRMFKICSTIVIIFSRNFCHDLGMRHLRANILMLVKNLVIYLSDPFEADDNYWRPALNDCSYHRSQLSLKEWSKILVCKMNTNDFFKARYEREEKKAYEQLARIQRENELEDDEESHHDIRPVASSVDSYLARSWPILEAPSGSSHNKYRAGLCPSFASTPVEALAMSCFNLVLGLPDGLKEVAS